MSNHVYANPYFTIIGYNPLSEKVIKLKFDFKKIESKMEKVEF